MNWNNYNDIYDLYINSTKILRLYGKKKAIQRAQIITADLFEGQRHIELVNIHTGEIIYST